MSPGEIVRNARATAGLTQRELARRIGTTQSTIAQLESPTANPRVATLARALSACGRELTIVAPPARSDVDETLIVENLRLTPGERIKRFERNYANMRELARAAAR